MSEDDDEWDVSEEEEEVAVKVVKVSAVAAPSKWEEEDKEEGGGDDSDVKDEWDASEDEEEEEKKKPAVKVKAPAAPKPVKAEPKKTPLQIKLAERKALEESQQRSRTKMDDLDEADDSALARKMREKNNIMESDLQNAMDLVSGGVRRVPTSGELGEFEGLVTLVPMNRIELLEYEELLKRKISTFEENPAYTTFIEHLLRDITSSLTPEETKKLSVILGTLSNEKQKAIKDAQTKGKKKTANVKKGVNVGGGAKGMARVGSVEDDVDGGDFDDFM